MRIEGNDDCWAGNLAGRASEHFDKTGVTQMNAVKVANRNCSIETIGRRCFVPVQMRGWHREVPVGCDILRIALRQPMIDGCRGGGRAANQCASNPEVGGCVMTYAMWLAGGLQLLIASANFFAPRKLRYAENLERVDRIVREIFVVHSVYIVLILTAFAGLCFAFSGELIGGSALARCLDGFLAVFWGLRVPIQLFHYNREIKRRHPIYNALFLCSFIALTAIFTIAAVR